jgi:hypothetical protein
VLALKVSDGATLKFLPGPFHFTGTPGSLFIDASIIHDTVAVIANEVKQSSKTKMYFFKPSGLPRRLHLLAMTGYYWIATSSTPLPRFARS